MWRRDEVTGEAVVRQTGLPFQVARAEAPCPWVEPGNDVPGIIGFGSMEFSLPILKRGREVSPGVGVHLSDGLEEG